MGIGKLSLFYRSAAQRVEHHQGVVALVGVDGDQYFLTAHVSSSSPGRLEGEEGQCNFRQSKPLLSHFLTGWPRWAQAVQEPERTKRRQPIHERHHLGPTLKGPRPSSSQGRLNKLPANGRQNYEASETVEALRVGDTRRSNRDRDRQYAQGFCIGATLS